LEEFRKKKEAALAAKQRQANTSTELSAPDQPAASSAHPVATSSSSHIDRDVEKYKEEAQALKDQVAQLLESVDGLHRALNDERYNSTQLEDQLRELRESKAAAEAAAVDGVAAATDAAALVAELEESRASASRYAMAAETSSAELEHANEKVENLAKELDSAQAALSSVVDLAAQLAEKEEAFQEIEQELAHQRDLNHKMKEELVEQAAAAEDAVAAEEAEVAKEIQLKNQITQLESSLESTRQELSSAVDLATERHSEVERLQNQVKDAEEAAAGKELAAEQQSLLEELEAALTSTREESLGLRGQVEALERELTDRADHEAAMRDEIEVLKVTAAEATARAQAAAESSAAEGGERGEQLANVLAERDALLGDLQAASTTASETQGKVAELQEAVEVAKAEAAAKTEEALAAAAALETSTSGTSNELNMLRAKAEASQMRIADLEGQLAEAYDAINNAEYKSKQLSDELKTLTAQSEKVLGEKAAADAAKEEAMTAMVQLQTQLAAGGAAGADVAEAEATAAEAVAALEMAQTQLEELNTTIDGLQSEKAALETQIQEAVERAAAAEMAGAEAAASAAQAAQAAVSLQAQGEVDILRAQLETANNEYAALFNKFSELEAANSGGAGAGTTEALQEEITTLQATIAEYQVECQRYAERVQTLETAAATAANGGGDSKQLQALMRRAEGAEGHVAQLQAETITLRAQVESERTRAAQLEAFAERQRAAQSSAGGRGGAAAGSSQVGDKKDEDNSLDMEAAALAGGSAFKPLVGLIRSLPAPLSHPLVVQGARELDRGMVALDARPHIRAAIIFYIALLHIMLLI